MAAMKSAIYRIILLAIVTVAIVGLDYVAGFVKDTAAIREASGMFRREAAPLLLRARHLIPDVDHRFTLVAREDPEFTGNPNDPRLFRTNGLGTIVHGKVPTAGEDVVRILFLGGSTTEGNEVDEAFRFPGLVGDLLSEGSETRFIGLNLGVRGNTSRDSVNLLINHPAVRQADYVVLMHNINDRLFLSLQGSYDAMLNRIGQTSWAVVKVSVSGAIASLWDYLSHRSNMLFLLRYKVLNENPWTGEHAAAVVDERAIDYSDPHFADSERAFRDNLRLYVAIANALGKRPILMTQPIGRPAKEHDKFNAVIRSFAQESDTLLIDLDASLPKDRRWLFLSDDIHLNNQGSRAIAELITENLRPVFLGTQQRAIVALGATELRFDRCLGPPDQIEDVAPGLRRLLLRETGRYPVFSPDERYIFFQRWTGAREIIVSYNRDTGAYSSLSPDTPAISDRYPTVITGAGQGGPTIAFARKRIARSALS